MKFPVVYIKWEDAKGAHEWHNVKDWEHSPIVCESVGWLVKEDAKGLTLVGALSSNDNIGNLQYILKSGVTDRVLIRKGDSDGRVVARGRRA